jgi:hypothetical protein
VSLQGSEIGRSRSPRLSGPWPGLAHAAPWLALGLLTAVSVRVLGASLPSATGRLDLLLLAASLSGMGTALVWLACQGAARSTAWAVAWGACIWIPYVNLAIASLYARHYWSDGARAPALLGIAAMLGQTAASLRLLEPALPTLV